jgi:hypothetical protein
MFLRQKCLAGSDDPRLGHLSTTRNDLDKLPTARGVGFAEGAHVPCNRAC